MSEEDVDGKLADDETARDDEQEDISAFTEEEMERDLQKIKKGVEDFKKTGKKKKDKVTPYSKIPESLLFDNKIPPTPKLVYAAYFKFSPQKDLDEIAWTFVGQSTIATHLTMSRETVSKLTRLLERERWIEIIKRGQGRRQITVLLPEQGRTLSHERRQVIRNTADAVIRQYYMDLKNK